MTTVEGNEADDESEYPLHALQFYWDGFKPTLICLDRAQDRVSELDLTDVRLRVSRRRMCVGYFDGDTHVVCPDRAEVTRFTQCAKCAEEVFIPDQECVFEPRCDGTNPACGAKESDVEFCRREHVLYIAFYDTRMKIGMSSARRVDVRLVEQGADAFTIIGKYGNRRSAREAEKSISERLRMPQFHRQDDLLRNFVREVNRGGIEGRFEALRMTLGQAYSLVPEPLRWIDGYPIKLPLGNVPRLQDSWGRHVGSHVGIKGKWLIYESEGLKALNLSDLPSRFLAKEVP